MGGAEHLLAAAAAATVLLLDLRRPALPVLAWKHGACTCLHMRLRYISWRVLRPCAPPRLVYIYIA